MICKVPLALALALALLAPAAGHGQSSIAPSSPAATPGASAVVPNPPAGSAAPAASAPSTGAQGSVGAPAAAAEGGLPTGFRGIELGMSMEEVQNVLQSDPLFSYRGEPDVSLLRRPNESLIEVSGTSFVKRAWFQFYEGKLFVMIFAMNEAQMDHYAIFTTLRSKYGKPSSLSPSESVWTDGTTRISVERPLAVKYIDVKAFEEIQAKGQALESYEELLRAEFLQGF